MMSATTQLELISPDFLPAPAQNGYHLCVYQDITDMDSSELSFMRKYHTVIQNSRIPSRPNSRSCCIHINYRYFKTLQKIYLRIIHTCIIDTLNLQHKTLQKRDFKTNDIISYKGIRSSETNKQSRIC